MQVNLHVKTEGNAKNKGSYGNLIQQQVHINEDTAVIANMDIQYYQVNMKIDGTNVVWKDVLSAGV